MVFAQHYLLKCYIFQFNFWVTEIVGLKANFFKNFKDQGQHFFFNKTHRSINFFLIEFKSNLNLDFSNSVHLRLMQ